MFGGKNLSTEMIDQIILQDKNARMGFMECLIGNAERHGETDVELELSKTLEEQIILT
jgi:hypothetical protein